MNHIAVSVIVPVYNKEKYLKDCLDSIIFQSLKEIEIIIVDDGSTDNGKEICEKYLTDKRVSYYFQENEGLASARQNGIDRAKGEYVGFIDADDWIELDMFEKMYEKAKEYDVDVVFCNRMYNNDAYRPSKEIPSGYYDRKRILTDVLPKTLAYIDEKGRKKAISWSNCRRIFRKQMLIENNIVFDKRFRRSQDLQLTYESMLCAKGFYHLGDEYFYHARTVGDSLARGYTKNMWSLYIPLIERLYNDTEEFKDLDLMPQMHLRTFYFVTDCIENEFKPLCPNKKKKSIQLISEIIEHPICDKYCGHIEVHRLNDFYKKYYEFISKKEAKKIYEFTVRYRKKQQFRKKYVAPILDILTEGPVVGKLYKKIRKCFK